MVPDTITPAVGAVFHCNAMARLRRSPLHLPKRTRLSSLLRLNLNSSLNATWFHSSAVHFPRVWHHSKRRRRLVGVKGSTRNGCRDPKCPSTRHLRMVREDTETPNEGTTSVGIAADEAVGCTRAFLTMGWSSRRLAIQECTSFGREFSTSKYQMLEILDYVSGARTLVSRRQTEAFQIGFKVPMSILKLGKLKIWFKVRSP
ncbi:uncharacterized protein TNCV_3763691 [Trichonephila clavipes]|uniref:Uncharacterized protein n=1 Tax=Trichonephila clavipes TaxID=2585209 RepID=A0A8X6VVA2_TRICX|nr:uncharacterized protein TNCV_3763691 [Trichonephila clavipes]